MSNLIAELDGAAYVARGAVNNAGNVARTKKMIRRALETQEAGLGFSFVEILTMCPTGWFIETTRRARLPHDDARARPRAGRAQGRAGAPVRAVGGSP